MFIKKIYMRFSQLSLQNKLIVLYITLFMIPVIIIVINYSNIFYKNAIKDITRNNEYLMEMERIHIDKNIETMRESAQIIASDYDIIEFVSNKREKSIEELMAFQTNHMNKMVKVQTVNPSIADFRFFIDHPALNEMWPILFRESRIKETPWYEQVIQRNGTELWWLKQEDYHLLSNIRKDSPKISLLRKVNEPYTEHLGIIEISMLQQNFFPKMYSPIPDGSSEIIVINNQNNIYRNPANSFLDDQQFVRADYEKILSHLDHQEKTDSFLLTNRKIPYLVVSSYIKGIEAYMVNIISLEDIYSETRKARNLTLGMAFVFLLLLSIITYVMISFLLKRMYRLIDNMKQVEKGDFSTKIDIDGHGEFAVLAFHFRNMLNKINKLIADAVYKQAVTKDTELKALKNQIDSHFLYNTLENIKMMAEIDGKYEISDSLTSLGEMMRYNIKWKNEFVVLSEEVSHINNYIDIMNLRLDEPILFQVDIPEELLEQEILKLSLQPIVENAIKYGIEPHGANGQGIIHVKVYLENQIVYIEVKDNGVGMSKEKVDSLNENIQKATNKNELQSETGQGIGLRNVNERIAIFYGKEYGIHVMSEREAFTTVVIKLPYLVIRGARKNV
ncbi:sensor histidine kinase [Lederbergia lenta]|uniref:histidine kinase n=1 Tax=Lederbergia lenta TaxID=1467 RepID=A0A2X4ZE70_LEDLE|nr:histidine kinase [Lederbergia lenta]MEC2323165.1 histidine kinase [Lederbergia lenta]SQI62875.1 two-component sensor histidine kinase YesM [Lederbergia lenta]